MPSMLARTRNRLPTAIRTVYNPIGFDPIEILPDHLRRYSDHARYFLHVLYSQRAFKDVKGEYVPLKAAYLRRFFPSNEVYRQVREALLASGTIVCDGIYRQADCPTWRNSDERSRGGKCFGYKLGPRWEDVRHERTTLMARPLIQSIAKVDLRRQSEIVTLPHRHIWRCLQDITINLDAAMMELDDLMVNATPEEIDGYAGQRMLCDGIRGKDLFWHICPFGRVYNNLTGIKKSLRRHLRANNSSLVACDVTNSQPLLVGLLCRRLLERSSIHSLTNSLHSSQFDHYELDQDLLDRISLPFPQKQEEERGGEERNSLYDVVFTESSQLISMDLLRYINLCEEGKLYDELMALEDNQNDRDKFKKQIFTQVFYGQNFYESKLTRLFAEEFPTVWTSIQAIKKEDYKRLSHHMLRLESEIVINRAVRRCALEGIWVVTIHDCLVTVPEQAERVREIMVEAFGAVGIKPTIKVMVFD